MIDHSGVCCSSNLILIRIQKVHSIRRTIAYVSLRIRSDCQILDLSSSSIVCGDVIVLESICTIRQSVSHHLRRLGICASKLNGIGNIVSTLIPRLAISAICHVIGKSFNNINQTINSDLVTTRNSKCLVRSLCQHSTNCFLSNQLLVLKDQIASVTKTSAYQSNATDVSVYSIPGECVTTKAEVITPSNDNQSQVTSTGRSVIIRRSTVSQSRILCFQSLNGLINDIINVAKNEVSSILESISRGSVFYFLTSDESMVCDVDRIVRYINNIAVRTI